MVKAAIDQKSPQKTLEAIHDPIKPDRQSGTHYRSF
jgi:hypothetical protein